MPRVSVIIPTYQRPVFLEKAIASVLIQTFQDFEVIIVDDASNDNTQAVVQGFLDKRIRYICHEVNKGGGTTRNTGISKSCGQYLAFLDDDDEWLPEKLELQVSLLDQSSPKVGGIYAGHERIMSASGESLGITLPSKRGDLSYELLLHNPLAGTSALLLRKECFEAVGLFDERLSSYQDYDLWIRISKKFHFDYVNKVLYRYYVHDKKIWTNPLALSKGLEIMAKKHCTKDLAVRKYYSSQFLSVGVMLCYAGNLEQGRRSYWTAIKLNPFEMRGFFNLVLSLLGADNFSKLKELKTKIFS